MSYGSFCHGTVGWLLWWKAGKCILLLSGLLETATKSERLRKDGDVEPLLVLRKTGNGDAHVASPTSEGIIRRLTYSLEGLYWRWR
jgi:hypothetical protein